ncbi:stage V sporulation protein E [Brevibacillus centrosporus]|uniref:Spore cortex peptidoglycan biosynthesis regulator SpoVE n=1 Tax=Brevibacillus centrosporus TaxID=54910 RepID=A0A1I3SWB5_9BACL|nr:stage V sporulation protein E [Brevibacillus centrosporus]MEC2128162.1 stage V sporulation protein E [Brevibacillus centrosporus]MED4909583.1 stage V sporulation protein E [Brevibacillus centrosporus]RNB73972.1 stage V sporulation protein E [Brevibacillus centrosporus]SFJ62700.1 spore cortex peptidoglycan biosynthesis regulator SpoVE [Brevibacillus centrosporus]GED30622.1 stage V sporulation protein E [Brevibacillus centrosporus]
MSKVRSAPDFVIIFATLFLLGIGIVMVYSASAIVAQKAPFNDPYFFAKRQLIFALLGITAMYVTMNVDYWVWKQWAKPGFYASIGLLILVLIVGIEVNGSKSWLGFGAFGIQPGEFAKLGVVAFLARWLSDNQKQIVLFRKGLVPALAIPLVCFALIMLQPDLGTGTVLMGTAVVMIFASGARISHFAALGMVGVAGFIGLILSAPYRIKRITSFLDPWSDPLNTGYQIIQSLYAIGPGGLLGLGLGQSRQKHLYLPEPYNDFIFSIVAEELGFIGGTLILLLFLLLLWRGMRTAITAPDLFGSLLALGIIGMIAIQVVINIGVVTGMFPVTGITLPFLSYGGSSLTLMLTGVGVLLNISRFSR